MLVLELSAQFSSISSYLPFLFLAALLLFFIQRSYGRRERPWLKQVPGSLDSDPLVRNLSPHPWLFGLDILKQDLIDLYAHNASSRALARHVALGETYQSSLLGQPAIYTISGENIRTVTTGNFADYGKGAWTKTIARYMGNGILVNDGDLWHKSRTLLKPLFRRNRAADVRMFESHADSLVEHIRQQDGDFVDFRRAAQTVVSDITVELLTGESTSSFGNRDPKKRAALLDLIDQIEPYGDMAIELGVFSLPIFVLYYFKIRALVKGLEAFFTKAVNEQLSKPKDPESGVKKENLISELFAQGLTRPQVQGELQNIFFAAFDTTTALITNLFDCLAREPQTVERLRQELAAVVGSGRLTETDIPRLTYLRAAIYETLRLHSPVTYHTRTAKTDTWLPFGGGADQKSPILVRRDTTVTWSTYALHRMMEGKSDSAEFRPDRWLRKRDSQLSHDSNSQMEDAFMPFGTGPRNCLGQQFAMMQTTYIAARLLLEFESFGLKNPDLPFQEAAAVTHYNGHGTFIKFQ